MGCREEIRNMGKSEQLNELFVEWRLEQSEEKGYNWEVTGISQESFTVDGIVEEGIWNNLQPEKQRVLYLLREANGNASKRTDTGTLVDEGEFWFKKCVGENHIGNRIFKRIAAMQRVIQKQEKLSDEEALQQVAYMNINKRGGGATVDWKVLNKYAEEYHEYIKKEICIINPDIIVCCGTYWPLVDIVCNLYKPSRDSGTWNPKKDFYLKNVDIKVDEYKCSTSIINMYHPSARMSDDTYIDRFEKIFKDEKIEVDRNLIFKRDDIIKIIKKLDEKSEQYMELCEFLTTLEKEK